MCCWFDRWWWMLLMCVCLFCWIHGPSHTYMWFIWSKPLTSYIHKLLMFTHYYALLLFHVVGGFAFIVVKKRRLDFGTHSEMIRYRQVRGIVIIRKCIANLLSEYYWIYCEFTLSFRGQMWCQCASQGKQRHFYRFLLVFRINTI